MRPPQALSFLLACAGSIYLVLTSNPLGAPLLVLSLALAGAYFYAERIHAIAPLKQVKSVWLGKLALAVLAASIVLYIALKNVLFAVLSFAALVALIIEEVVPRKWSAKEIRLNAIELAWALAAAVFAWIALTIVLGTPSPIDVVTSCSMRPVLERGDLVILSGGEARAPEARYYGQRLVGVKQPCIIEKKGLEEGALCTESIIVGNETFSFNKENDIIVYEPSPRITDLIIHRAFARLRDEKNRVFYVTRGDNNRHADQEAGISLVPQEHTHGKVILRIPFLGYFKLFLFMQFEEPEGCDYIIKPLPQ